MSRALYRLVLRFGWIIGVFLVLVSWFGALAGGLISPRELPILQDVFVRLLHDLASADVWKNILVTVTAWLIAVPLGFSCGVLIAVALFMFPAAYRNLQPYLIFANAVPRVVLAPVFILAFGLGIQNRVALGVSLILFPTILGVHGGLRLCDPAMLASVEIFGARTRDIWRHVRLPAVLPYLVSNWRLAMSLGLLGAIVGEILVAPSGLGYLLRIRAGIFDLSGVFSALFLVLALALSLNLLTDRVAARLLRWQ